MYSYRYLFFFFARYNRFDPSSSLFHYQISYNMQYGQVTQIRKQLRPCRERQSCRAMADYDFEISVVCRPATCLLDIVESGNIRSEVIFTWARQDFEKYTKIIKK